MKDKILVLVIIFCVWQTLHYFDSFLIPSLFEIVKVVPKVLTESKGDILSSIFRVVESFMISIVIAVPAGLILGKFKRFYSAVSYVLDFFRSTPATALFPLFLIIFGVGDSSKIVSAAFASFLIVTFNLAEGIVRIHKHKLLTAKIMGASNMQTIKKIIFWESLPYLFIGLRNGISTSMIVVIVTEMFIGTMSGIGKKIIDFQITYEISSMYVMIFIVGTLGYVLNQMLFLLEKRIVHWHEYRV